MPDNQSAAEFDQKINESGSDEDLVLCEGSNNKYSDDNEGGDSAELLTQFRSSQITRPHARAMATVGCGGVTPPQATSLSAKLLRIKVLSAIFRKSILLQEDDS